jgi:hypothetical protein
MIKPQSWCNQDTFGQVAKIPYHHATATNECRGCDKNRLKNPLLQNATEHPFKLTKELKK